MKSMLGVNYTKIWNCHLHMRKVCSQSQLLLLREDNFLQDLLKFGSKVKITSYEHIFSINKIKSLQIWLIMWHWKKKKTLTLVSVHQSSRSLWQLKDINYANISVGFCLGRQYIDIAFPVTTSSLASTSFLLNNMLVWQVLLVIDQWCF